MSSTDPNPQERWQQIQKAFEKALELAPEARAHWPESQDLAADVRDEVAQMVAAHEGPGLAIEAGVGGDLLPERIGACEVLRSLDSELRACLHYARTLVELGDEAQAAQAARGALERMEAELDPGLREALTELAGGQSGAPAGP